MQILHLYTQLSPSHLLFHNDLFFSSPPTASPFRLWTTFFCEIMSELWGVRTGVDLSSFNLVDLTWRDGFSLYEPFEALFALIYTHKFLSWKCLVCFIQFFLVTAERKGSRGDFLLSRDWWNRLKQHQQKNISLLVIYLLTQHTHEILSGHSAAE